MAAGVGSSPMSRAARSLEWEEPASTRRSESQLVTERAESATLQASRMAARITAQAPGSGRQKVLVLDFGSQYSQLIARRVREAHVYCELVPGTTPWAELRAREPAGLILSGGPSSVYDPGAPQVDPEALRAGVPVLGICCRTPLLAH